MCPKSKKAQKEESTEEMRLKKTLKRNTQRFNATKKDLKKKNPEIPLEIKAKTLIETDQGNALKIWRHSSTLKPQEPRIWKQNQKHKKRSKLWNAGTELQISETRVLEKTRVLWEEGERWVGWILTDEKNRRWKERIESYKSEEKKTDTDNNERNWWLEMAEEGVERS